jgi:hypothetical protein
VGIGEGREEDDVRVSVAAGRRFGSPSPVVSSPQRREPPASVALPRFGSAWTDSILEPISSNRAPLILVVRGLLVRFNGRSPPAPRPKNVGVSLKERGIDNPTYFFNHESYRYLVEQPYFFFIRIEQPY